MNHTYPTLKVNDIETTIMWYTDFIGFQCTYKNSIKNTEYAVIEKDAQKIYLIKDESREAYASNVVIIETTDIEAEYSFLENSGAIITKPIGKGSFSKNEFEIKDYEDNKLIYIKKI
jgi:predicted enzyme related to lactoylglutathione lyase